MSRRINKLFDNILLRSEQYVKKYKTPKYNTFVVVGNIGKELSLTPLSILKDDVSFKDSECRETINHLLNIGEVKLASFLFFNNIVKGVDIKKLDLNVLKTFTVQKLMFKVKELNILGLDINAETFDRNNGIYKFYTKKEKQLIIGHYWNNSDIDDSVNQLQKMIINCC